MRRLRFRRELFQIRFCFRQQIRFRRHLHQQRLRLGFVPGFDQRGRIRKFLLGGKECLHQLTYFRAKLLNALFRLSLGGDCIGNSVGFIQCDLGKYRIGRAGLLFARYSGYVIGFRRFQSGRPELHFRLCERQLALLFIHDETSAIIAF